MGKLDYPRVMFRPVSQLFLFYLFLTPAFTLANTISDRYEWLENPSDKRSQFISDERNALNSRLQALPDYDKIKYWLFELYDVPVELKELRIDATHSLHLIERGLKKPTELVLNSPEGETVLLSNDTNLRNTTRNIISFGLSPDKKTVDAVIEKDGSIDQMQVVLFDLATSKKLDQELSASLNSIAWLSASKLAFASMDENLQRCLSIYDLTTGKTDVIPGGFIISDFDNSVIYSHFDGKENHYFLDHKTDGALTPFWCVGPTQIISEDALGISLLCNGASGLGELRNIPFATKVQALDIQYGKVLVPEEDRPIRAAVREGNYFFITRRDGAHRWVDVYPLSGGDRSAEVPVPNCCTMSLNWSEVGKTLTATLVSAVKEENGFNYDVASNTWDRDPDTAMMALWGDHFKTEIKYATSKDGTPIPVRLTYRENIKADLSHPVLFNSYGGFAGAGSLDPSYNKVEVEFLRRGGILAGPGLRGGNEYGPSWHESAMKLNKIKTYEDLDAAAKLVLAENWTTQDKIISTGTSNGGLTVAATALLFPDDFGLVIPISGVHDLLGKERMDPRFSGWDSEYGSANDADSREALLKISPLENVQNLKDLHFLILDGVDDTRVNAAHSLKFAAALKDLGGTSGEVGLATFQDAGHWLADFNYQNAIAWQANTLIWVEIFYLAGWTF